ncbi:MAG: hypothetical protein ACLRVU_12705 [Beduini sp.]
MIEVLASLKQGKDVTFTISSMNHDGNNAFERLMLNALIGLIMILFIYSSIQT